MGLHNSSERCFGQKIGKFGIWRDVAWHSGQRANVSCVVFFFFWFKGGRVEE